MRVEAKCDPVGRRFALSSELAGEWTENREADAATMAEQVHGYLLELLAYAEPGDLIEVELRLRPAQPPEPPELDLERVAALRELAAELAAERAATPVPLVPELDGWEGSPAAWAQRELAEPLCLTCGKLGCEGTHMVRS